MTFPIVGHRGEVEPGWIDENDHVDTIYYKTIADRGAGALFRLAGIDKAYREAAQATFFQAEMHICYERELRLGDSFAVLSWLIGADAKRIHHLHEIIRTSDGVRAASVELMTLHIDLVTRRSAPMASAALHRLQLLADAGVADPAPAHVHGRISLVRCQPAPRPATQVIV